MQADRSAPRRLAAVEILLSKLDCALALAGAPRPADRDRSLLTRALWAKRR